MEPERSVNPYAFTETGAPAEQVLSGNRMPTPLVVLAILLLVMGGWGALGGCLAGIGLGVQAAILSQPVPADESRPHQELEQRMRANHATLLPFTVGSVIVSFLLSIPMFVGAIGLLMRKAWARWLTIRTIYVNAVCSALEAILAGVALYLQYSILFDYMEVVPPTGSFGVQGGTFASVMVVVQIFVTALIYAYEFAVYWFGASYLRRDAVKAIFS